MHASWVLALKDLKLLLRQPAELFFALGWPLITAILFGVVFSGSGGATAKPKVAIADLDGTANSAAFVEQVRALPEFEVDVVAADAASELVRTGKRTAAVLVPAGDQRLVDALLALDFRVRATLSYFTRGGGTAPPAGSLLCSRVLA